MAKSRKLKNVTNEELGRMIAEGFNSVTEQFESVATKEQLNDIGEKVESIDNRLRIVEAKLDKALYTEINRLEARVKKLEEKAGFR